MLPTEPELRAAHHRELEAAFDALMRAHADGDPHALATRWNALAATVREHLAIEEDRLFAAYQQIAPDQADQLRTEHAKIRALLDATDRDVQRHALRPQRLRQLLDLLRLHIAHEDASVYAWAEDAERGC